MSSNEFGNIQKIDEHDCFAGFHPVEPFHRVDGRTITEMWQPCETWQLWLSSEKPKRACNFNLLFFCHEKEGKVDESVDSLTDIGDI